MFPKSFFVLTIFALLVSTALSASLAACRQVPEGGSPSLRVTPSSSPTPTDTPKPTETPTPTATETPTPEPAWMTTMEAQDPQDKFFKVIDGKPIIDLYDTQSQESIGLNENTIKITATTDGLNPNILTAYDAENNQYALNPDSGWFKVPQEVQMDYNKYQEYTELPYRYFGDGTANIINSLKYAENPTISPDAIIPRYWANHSWFKNVLYVGLFPMDEAVAYAVWPDLTLSSFFKPEQRPFAWNGFFTTTLPSGEKIYINARTLKNPTEKIPIRPLIFFTAMMRGHINTTRTIY